MIKGAAYLYMESIVSMLSGYLFWLLVSRFTTPETIGAASAIVSLSAIFSILGGLGIQSGIQRFLGMSFLSNNMGDAKLYIIASFIITILGTATITTVIVFSFNWMAVTFKIDASLLIILIVLMSSTTSLTLLRATLVSSLETKILPIIMTIFSVVKIIIALLLIWANTGALGVLIGFTSFPLIASSILGFNIAKKLSKDQNRSNLGYGTAIKQIMQSSIVTWIPVSVYTLGLHLGPLVIIGSHGVTEGGIYFIAFSVVTAITASMSALYSIALPKLSAMNDGRKRFAWKVLKMSLAIIVPFSAAIMFYSDDVMKIFGEQYVNGASSLEILLLSMVPTAVSAGINTLTYAYGNYRHVLFIGLASNVPRALLYFLLVPLYENNGAAISYSLGSLIGLIASIIVAREISFKIFWKDVILTLIIPIFFAFMFTYAGVIYYLGIFLSTGVSYLVLIALHVLTRQDIRDILEFIPHNLTNPLVRSWHRIYRKLRSLY